MQDSWQHETFGVHYCHPRSNCGLWALYLASRQLINIGDETIYKHLKDQIVKTIYYLAGLDIVKRGYIEDSQIYEILLESALTIATSAQPSEVTIREFVDLFSQLTESRHPIVGLCWPIVQRLYQELPTSQAKQFVPLLLRLRAVDVEFPKSDARDFKSGL